MPVLPRTFNEVDGFGINVDMSHHRWYQSVGDFDCRWSGESRIVFKKHNSCKTAPWHNSGVLVNIVRSRSLRKFAAVRYSGSKSKMMAVALSNSYHLVKPDRTSIHLVLHRSRPARLEFGSVVKKHLLLLGRQIQAPSSIYQQISRLG
jgi:hypothetical protein